MTTLVSRYRALFLPHTPTRRARMNPPTAAEKYIDIKGQLTDAELAAHLDGSQTWAATLIGRDGLSREGGLDIDHGGEPALKRALDVAAELGISAHAVTSTNEDHDGGHLRCLFDEAIEPDRIRRLMLSIAEQANVSAEIFPSGQNLRLPFGVHTWTQQRGRLRLQSGEVIELDAPGALARALDALEALPCNPVSLAPPLPKPEPKEPQTVTSSGPSVIADFNRQHSALTLLEGYGARIAKRYSNGSILLHCPCGNHAHGDRRASLLLKKATSARYGAYIALGYSAACAFYTERGQVVDAFGIYTHMERLDAKVAVKRVAPPNEAAQRKREARKAEAAATSAEIRERLAQDDTLPKRARAILEAMLQCAAERAWCRPSKARLGEMTGYSVRSVTYALKELEQAGYLSRHDTHGAGTHIWTFLRVQRGEPVAAELHPKEEEHVTAPAQPAPPATVAPVPEPEPVPEGVSFEGGATYDPMAAAPRFLPSADVATALAEVTTMRRLPPTDPVRAARYWKLLGKAEKVEATKPAQAAALRAKAALLEELRPAGPVELKPSRPVLKRLATVPPAPAEVPATAGGRSQAPPAAAAPLDVPSVGAGNPHSRPERPLSESPYDVGGMIARAWARKGAQA